MRKVTFPAELDVVEFCTDELQKRLIPLRDKIREIRKDEQDAERARKRQKITLAQEENGKAESEVGAAIEPTLVKADGGDKDADTAMSVFKSDAEYEAERAASLLAAKKELYSLIDPQLAADDGSNTSGLYDLRAVITHQGASADSGHYTAYVKKQGRLVEDSTAGGKRLEEDGKWWWFNDDRVTEVDAEKIETLAGGGESHSALVLLYRAIDLPTAEEAQQ